jgi:hypothetical protein
VDADTRLNPPAHEVTVVHDADFDRIAEISGQPAGGSCAPARVPDLSVPTDAARLDSVRPWIG